MEKKINRANRHIKNRAEHQDVAAIFQLYRSHKSEGDEVQAEHYLASCEAILSNSNTKIILTEIRLVDFRQFNDFYMDFNDRLTVLVGENGVGKTTIVEGVAKALSWIAANLEKENNTGKMVTLTDINVNSTQYAEVVANFFLTKKNRYSISLSKSVAGAGERKDSSVRDIKALADLYRMVNDYRQINLPVFAFYTADRARVSSSIVREKLDDIVRPSPMDAYADIGEGRKDFDRFLDFFAQLDNRAQVRVSVSQEQIKEFTELEAALRKLADDGKLSYGNELWQLLEQKRQQIVTPVADSNAAKQLQVVKRVIIGFIPGATDLFVDRSSGRPELKIIMENAEVGIGVLSHGQQTVIGMISDLVRRLMMLNPNRENPLDGQGVVVIDEIELHLHPKWQQNIIPSLLKTFPGIQFVVTTHSPQVITTVERSCIRILHQVEDDISGIKKIVASNAGMQTKGIASSDVLAEIMGIDPVPDEPEAKKLSLYRSLIEKNSQNDQDAIGLRRELNNHFGPNHPVMFECDRLIRLQEMKNKFSKRS